MEKFNVKCKVEKNERSYVIADDNIEAGEEILLENPILITPNWDSEIRCSNCFRESNIVCKKCDVFPMCVACEDHDSFDCEFFQKAVGFSKNLLIENFSVFGPLKCLMLLDNPEKSTVASEILKLPSFTSERRNSDIWEEHEKNVVGPLMQSGLPSLLKTVKVDSELIQKICGIIDGNSFEIRNSSGDSVKGIYPFANNLTHNCTPNTMMAVGFDLKMKIISTIPIEKGSLVQNCYVSPLVGTGVRQHLLKNGKYITCNCDRCEDPTEFGTFMSSLICRACFESYLINKNSAWICISCSFEMPTTEVNEILIDANNDILDADGDIRQMEYLIQKFSKMFHPNHYLIIDLKQSVASILRSICTASLVPPGKAVMDRKIQLCEEILPVLKVIQPGISRLNAIAMYEYFVPLVEVAEIDFEEKVIGKEKYLEILTEAEKLAKESARMLLYEPVNSPEGDLAQQVMQHVKKIRNRISKI